MRVRNREGKNWGKGKRGVLTGVSCASARGRCRAKLAKPHAGAQQAGSSDFPSPALQACSDPTSPMSLSPDALLLSRHTIPVSQRGLLTGSKNPKPTQELLRGATLDPAALHPSTHPGLEQNQKAAAPCDPSHPQVPCGCSEPCWLLTPCADPAAQGHSPPTAPSLPWPAQCRSSC